MAKKGRQGGKAQKQEEPIGGRKGGKEDRRKGREAGRDRTRYEVSVVTRGDERRGDTRCEARARMQERERETWREKEKEGEREGRVETTRIDQGEIKRDGAIRERSLNSTSERRQSVLNARLRECARTRYARARVRVHIGASIYAPRCGIATEKVHVVGKSSTEKRG